MVTYEYDAWGNLTNMTDTSGKNLGEINPFRYRSYYYDEDTGWYYLQSRYYDAEIGRFLNADDVEYLGSETIEYNLFTYCKNDPVNSQDFDGHKRSYRINRSLIAGLIDRVILAFPILSAAFAPIKVAAKAGGRHLANVLKKYVPKVFNKVLANGRNIVLQFAKRAAKIPFIGKKAANKLKKLTARELFANMFSGSINKIVSILLPNIDMCLSLGGFVAGIWDYYSDKRLNKIILIRI